MTLRVPGLSLSHAARERRHFRLLVESFFRQLFENDLLPEHVDLRLTLMWLGTAFAVPPMMIAFKQLFRYSVLAMLSPDLLEQATWADKLFFLSFSMMAVGFLTVLVWDALFPDRRDLVVLGSLPVRDRTVWAAKLAALTILILGFAAATAVLPAVAFALAASGTAPVVVAVRYPFAHVLAATAAGAFTFFVLIAVQTVLILLLPTRVRSVTSVAAQLAFVILIIEMFFFASNLSIWLGDHVLSVAQRDTVTWIPPLWFLGLYEALLGTDHAEFRALAIVAAVAVALSAGLAALAYAASYRWIARSAMEDPHRRLAAGVVARSIERWWLPRRPVDRAVFSFVVKSLVRSRRHRLLLAVYVGLGLALILGSFLQPLLRGEALIAPEPTLTVLSVPFVLSFFTLVALRVLITVPTELHANWIFQMTEGEDKAAYLRGVRQAMLALGLAPLAALTFPLYWWAWGPGLAVGHTALWVLLGSLLSEVLLLWFRKVPFACACVPGRARLRALLPVYLLVMTTYSYSTARLELWLLAAPARWTIACAVLAGILAALILTRTRWQPQLTRFEYDEPPEETPITLLQLMRPV